MSLVLFSCRATGPFIMFEETARRVFKVLGRPWTETGAFSCDELPEILRILDEEARKDKERLAQIEAERERKLRESTYDEELRMREEEKEEKRNSVEKINFFQRVVPLQSMIKRAISVSHHTAVIVPATGAPISLPMPNSLYTHGKP